MNPFTQLLSDCQHLAADPLLADIPILIEGEGRAIAVASRSRAANVATLKFAAPHKIKNLGLIRVEDLSAADYDVEKIAVAVVDATTLTYASEGDDEAETVEAVGIITPLLIPVNEAVEKGLAQGGLLRGPSNKGGMAILLILQSGNPADADVPEAEDSLLRISLFCNPLLNASGLKKPPLDVQADLRKRMSAWRRGDGTTKPKFLGWDSRENTEGETGWFADYSVFHMFN